jgi:hypothetical protein
MSVPVWLVRLRERVAELEAIGDGDMTVHPATLHIPPRQAFTGARVALAELRRRRVSAAVEVEKDGTRWLVLTGGDLDSDFIAAVGQVRSELIRLLAAPHS